MKPHQPPTTPPTHIQVGELTRTALFKNYTRSHNGGCIVWLKDQEAHEVFKTKFAPVQKQTGGVA